MSHSDTGRTEKTKIAAKPKPKRTETAKTASSTGKPRKQPISSSNGHDTSIKLKESSKAPAKSTSTVDAKDNGAREAPKPIDSYTFTAKYAMPFATQKRGFFKTKTIVDMFKWSLKFVEDQNGIFAVQVVGTFVKGLARCEGMTIVSTIASNMITDEQGEIYRVIPPFLPELDPIDSVPPSVAAVIKSIGLPADWPLFLRFIWEQRQLGPNKDNIPKLTAPPRPARLPPAPVLKAYILSQSTTSRDTAKAANGETPTAGTSHSEAQSEPQKTKKRKRVVLSTDSEDDNSSEDSDDVTFEPTKKPKSKVNQSVSAAKPTRSAAPTRRTKKLPAKEPNLIENVLSENTDGIVPSTASESTATKKRTRSADREHSEPPSKAFKGKTQTVPSNSRNEGTSCILDSDGEEESQTNSMAATTKATAGKRSTPFTPPRTPTKHGKTTISGNVNPKTPTALDEWTSTQLSALEDALMTVDPSDPQYFTSITRKVRGKTIAQVQRRITHMKEEKLEIEQKLSRVPKSRKRPVPSSPLSMDADMSKKKNLKKLEHAEAELMKKRSTDIFDDPHFLKSRGLTSSSVKVGQEEDDAFSDDSDDDSEEDDFLASIASVRSQVDIVKARMGNGQKKSAKTASSLAKGKSMKKTASASTSSKSGVSLVSKLLADIEQGKRQVQDAQDEQDEIELEDGIADHELI